MRVASEPIKLLVPCRCPLKKKFRLRDWREPTELEFMHSIFLKKKNFSSI